MRNVDEGADAIGRAKFEALPERVQEALGELAGAAKEGLLALSVGVGLGVLSELMAERTAVRRGSQAGQVTLSGRRVRSSARGCARPTLASAFSIPAARVRAQLETVGAIVAARVLRSDDQISPRVGNHVLDWYAQRDGVLFQGDEDGYYDGDQLIVFA